MGRAGGQGARQDLRLPRRHRRRAITVKLVESHPHALSVEGAEPTGYGLGKAGWVTVPVSGLPLATLRDWVEESYRIVAPKRLVAELDARREQLA